MKVIAEQYYYALVDEILKERLRESKSANRVFVGLTDDELHAEIEKRLGKPWAIEVRKVTLSASDVNALASARFLKETGWTLLMGLAIVILSLSIAVRYISGMTALYYNIYYVICGAVGLVFIYVYTYKLRKVRKEFHWKYGIRDSDEDK